MLRSISILAALAGGVQAFSVAPYINTRTSIVRTTSLLQQQQRQRASLLFAAEEESGDDVTFVKSALKKEIAYDKGAGRFFETGFAEGDCIPDEEFCMLDDQTGSLIRLTVEEKERIFLDSLQVRNGSVSGLLCDGEATYGRMITLVRRIILASMKISSSFSLPVLYSASPKYSRTILTVVNYWEIMNLIC